MAKRHTLTMFFALLGIALLFAGNACATAFPVDEAGISAYIETGQTIDLDKIKTIFPEVEEVGDNYIIGITPISDYGGNISVHVYADTDGWIVAYLKNDEPASKIMQWGTADVNTPVITTITTTILEDALHKAGDAASVGIVSSKIKYYDFEFPNANSMMIFIRTRATTGTNTHQVEIPADYMLFEASYYHYIYYYGYYHSSPYWLYWDSILEVDGMPISDADTHTSPSAYKWWRVFTSYGGKLTPGTLHTIEISYNFYQVGGYIAQEQDIGSAGVATVLIYRDGA